jgi:hypothetical protein
MPADGPRQGLEGSCSGGVPVQALLFNEKNTRRSCSKQHHKSAAAFMRLCSTCLPLCRVWSEGGCATSLQCIQNVCKPKLCLGLSSYWYLPLSRLASGHQVPNVLPAPLTESIQAALPHASLHCMSTGLPDALCGMLWMSGVCPYTVDTVTTKLLHGLGEALVAT